MFCLAVLLTEDRNRIGASQIDCIEFADVLVSVGGSNVLDQGDQFSGTSMLKSSKSDDARCRSKR